MNSFDMRPRSVGEVLDAAIKLYLSNARTLIGIVACIVVPLQIVSAIVLLSVASRGSQIPGNIFSLHLQTIHHQGQFQSTTTTTDANGAAELVRFLISSLMGALSTAACVRAVSDLYVDRQTSIGASLRFAVRRLPVLVVLYVVRVIGLAVAFVLLVIPGIWLYGSWAVATPALLVEGGGPLRALGRSRRLVRQRWWPVAGVILITSILSALVGSAFQALFGAIDGFSSHPGVFAAVLSVSLGATVTYLLVQPFSASVNTVLYYDLRVRHEGYDLQVLADQLGLPAPQPSDDGGEWRPGEPLGPDSVGRPGGPPFWPPPPGWRPASPDAGR